MFANRVPTRVAMAVSTLAISAVLLALVPSSVSAQEKVTLVLGNSQWLDRARGDGLVAAMKQYEQVNPDVTIEILSIPGSQISTVLTAQVGAGEGPDIMMIQDSLFFSLADAELLLQIPAGVTDGVALNETNEPAVIDGVRYGVAWQRAPFGIMYNRKLLAEAGVDIPTSPEELIAAARKIQEVTGVLGFGDLDITANTSPYTEQIDLWTRGYGGSWSKDGQLTVVTPENIEGVDAFLKVARSGILQNSQGFITTGTLPAFQQGQVAMMTDCCGAIATALIGTVPGEDIGFFRNPVPMNVGMHEQLFVAVNKNTANAEVALDFVHWLISPDGQVALRAASGADPLATDAPIPPEFAAQNPWAEELAEIGKNSRTLMLDGCVLQSFQIRQIIVDSIQRAVIENGDGRSALEGAAAEIGSQVSC